MMASNPQIIADLRVIMEKDQRLELLSIYKGVPFVYKAVVINLTDDSALLHTDDHCLICLMQETRATVLGSDYFEPAIADIESIDIPSGSFQLTNFIYAGTKLGERMLIRVKPKELVAVTLESSDTRTVGELVDISISGLGLYINLADYHPVLKPGVNVQLHMQIPTADINVTGTILSAYKLNESYRLSIRFAQDISQRSLIFRYLIDRRHEIEQEVQHIYQNHIQQRD